MGRSEGLGLHSEADLLGLSPSSVRASAWKLQAVASVCSCLKWREHYLLYRTMVINDDKIYIETLSSGIAFLQLLNKS